MALFRGIQECIALDANNITLVFDSGNIVNISGNIFLYPAQGHPILYKYYLCYMIPRLRGAKLPASRNFVPCKHSIWIAVLIILIQILGGLRCIAVTAK